MLSVLVPILAAPVVMWGVIWLVLVLRANRDDLPTIAGHLSRVFRHGKPMS